MRNKFSFSLIALFYLLSLNYSLAQDKKIGDERDGSRSKPIHVIKLLDENNNIILPDDNPQFPFSTKYTCGDCHSYEIISKGYHFNSPAAKSSFDRNGEPWIYLDLKSLTVLPLSYRGWGGTFSPEKVKISPFDFLKLFGTHYTGGRISEDESLEKPENYFRWEISGKLPVNCLICHDAGERFNSAEYSANILKQNFRWAAAAGTDFSVVKGSAKEMPDNFDQYNSNTFADVDLRVFSPPSVSYTKPAFNGNKVFFDIKRRIPNDRCYYCHSSANADRKENKILAADEDVHLKKGLLCVDCHTNGINHEITRGFKNDAKIKNDPSVISYTCEGCHLKRENANGKLGAPAPQHLGLPSLHLEKLSCTACHSGLIPSEKSGLVKTSRAHKLGLPGINKSANLLPHIQMPVYVKNEEGKIEPRKLLWASYWAELKDDKIAPLPVGEFSDSLSVLLKTDSLKTADGLQSVNDTLLTKALRFMNKNSAKGRKIIFVSGQNYFELSEKSELNIKSNADIKPYSWALAHDVRPAAQALGAKGCNDCHSWNSNFFFGTVSIETPYSAKAGSLKMNSFEELGTVYYKLLSLSFFFRPLLKGIIIFSLLVILLTVLVFVGKGILALAKHSPADSENNLWE